MTLIETMNELNEGDYDILRSVEKPTWFGLGTKVVDEVIGTLRIIKYPYRDDKTFLTTNRVSPHLISGYFTKDKITMRVERKRGGHQEVIDSVHIEAFDKHLANLLTNIRYRGY